MSKDYHLIINHLNTEGNQNELHSCITTLKQHKDVEAVRMVYQEHKLSTANLHLHILIRYKKVVNTTIRDLIKKTFKSVTLPNQFTYENIPIKEYNQIWYITQSKMPPKEVQEKIKLYDDVTEEQHAEYRIQYPNIENKKLTDYETYLKNIKHIGIDEMEFSKIADYTIKYLLDLQLKEDKQIPLTIVKNKALLYCRKYSEYFNLNYKEITSRRFCNEVCLEPVN